jgi:hypothetical protein
MSQLADLTEVVKSAPLDERRRAILFLNILEALNWEIDGVETIDDAIVYLSTQ